METKCSSSTCCASEGLGLRRWARYRGYARRARWGCARFALAAVPLAGLRGCGLELGWGAGAVRDQSRLERPCVCQSTRMDLGARRYTRNDILRDICCLIAPPIYSFIYKLNDIQVDPPDTPTDQIGDVEDTKTSQLSNICDVEPSSRHSNEVQQVLNTLRKRRNTSAQSDDQGQVDSSNIPIAHTGDSGDTNPSQLSNICDAKPSDTPNKNFIPSSSHSDEVQQVPNILTKCRNTFTQSDQGEENETGLGVTVGSRPTDQIGNVEDTKTLQLSNICDVEPSSSQHSNDVQQIPNTLRSTFAQSDDQGQVHPSNIRIAQIGNAEDTNPSPLSNTCEPSDTPNKDFVPSRSHSNEVQQVPNILRKRKNTFTQSDQGEENKIAHSLFSCEEKNLTPGDWNCVLCHQLNFQRRVSCQRCGEPRTGYHKGSFGGRISGIAGPDVRPGDWYCLNCTDHNFASRSSCFKCGASKDEPGSDMPNIRDFGFGSDSSGRKSGDWICTKFD
ncbi:hypothetical protein JRO89_XS02G0258200 [Xanthoceras sorbifolium]|uniref:RanBP2-type domain-containing protein n=1 Tax=Xanthoceras sorbifolium TaxID=99658 RepID=A0ABQ8IGZ2_9ROSI|nr:hypothetical protein JRO89_XS02G0258200 [Xanthoceras sorbifolium]